MKDRESAACKQRRAALLCVVLFLVAMEPATADASRSLNNPDQSCLDAGSSDVQRDCPVRTPDRIIIKWRVNCILCFMKPFL
jgi:hypothetical protein